MPTDTMMHEAISDISRKEQVTQICEQSKMGFARITGFNGISEESDDYRVMLDFGVAFVANKEDDALYIQMKAIEGLKQIRNRIDGLIEEVITCQA